MKAVFNKTQFEQAIVIAPDTKLDEQIHIQLYTTHEGIFANIHLSHSGVESHAVIAVQLSALVELGKKCELLQGEFEKEQATTQRLSPKYWVVHDVDTDDVLIDTASKNRKQSVLNFVKNHETGFNLDDLGGSEVEEPTVGDYCSFFDSLIQTRYRCDLIELDLSLQFNRV